MNRVGVIGCGVISATYLKNLTQSKYLRVVAVADLDPARARARAEEFGVPRSCSVDELLDDPEVDIVLNLTVPTAHAEVALRTLRAGKSVYGEKPLATNLADGLQLVQTAREKGLGLGSAPDTFLGAGIQTCRKVIKDGWIGTPVGASARFLSPGPESWHPDPRFLYQRGAGPLFDIGPYYLTALVELLGPVERVHALGQITHAERTIGSGPLAGRTFPVLTPTHWEALLETARGPAVSVSLSFDTPGGSGAPPIEIYGTEGTLQVPDPNTFDGPVRFRREGSGEWQSFPLVPGARDNARGIGLEEMVRGLRTGTPYRASGDLALHVLAIMEAWGEAAESGSGVTLDPRFSIA